MGMLTKALDLIRAPSPPAGAVVAPSMSLLGGSIPPPSHGYVHEPFAGAWQRNQECFGPSGIFSAVYACVQTIAGDIAKLPPRILLAEENGTQTIFDRHPAARVLWYPNKYQTRVDFWGQFVACALFDGNSYAFLVRDARNVIEAMHILDPRKTRPLIAPDGSIWYRTTQKQIVEQLGVEYIPARDILHHRLLCLSHPLVGVTPIAAAAYSAQTGQVIQRNAFNFFSNMSRASGVLTTPGNIGKEVLTRIKTEWEENFKGGGMGSTAVLQGGLKWESLGINAEDAQLVEQLRWTVEDVARCFRVPMYMISDASKISYKNSEQLNRNYYTQTLQYHLESIEARIDQTFDLADRIYVKFDLDALLMMELDVRMAAYGVAINAGVMTINEARRKEKLPPMAGGDEPLVQKQYVPLSKVEELATAAARAPAPPAPPGEAGEAERDDEEGDEDLDEEGEADLADEETSAALADAIQRRAQQWLAGERA
jgi:HK97 family phage portal protein